MSVAGVASPSAAPTRVRSHAIDLVRVVGIVAIVAGHTWSDHEWVHTWLYTWHVPVFFVISGYLWNPARSTRDELSRRTRTLLVPYLGWLVIVTGIWFAFLAIRLEDIAWGDYLADIALGGWYISRPYSAFWFVTALFFATVLMRWLANRSTFLPWFVGSLGVAWCIADPISIKQIPEAAGLALPAVLFLLVGQMLRRHRAMLGDPFTAGMVLLVPALLLGGFGVFDTLNMKSGVLGQPVLGMFMAGAISCGLILVAESLERFLRPWMGTLIAAVARAGLPIILGHALVLAMAQRLGLEPGRWMFLLAFFIPLAVGLVIERTRLRRVLL